MILSDVLYKLSFHPEYKSIDGYLIEDVIEKAKELEGKAKKWDELAERWQDGIVASRMVLDGVNFKKQYLGDFVKTKTMFICSGNIQMAEGWADDRMIGRRWVWLDNQHQLKGLRGRDMAEVVFCGNYKSHVRYEEIMGVAKAQQLEIIIG